MTDIPIIMSAPMVRALLDGRKTMTRRLAWRDAERNAGIPVKTRWQRVKPGDRIWVRENLCAMANWGLWHDAGPIPTQGCFLDDTDERGRSILERYAPAEATDSALVPSIHMPRWASRLTLIVTATRIERLQEISEADAKAEGCGLFVPGHGWITEADLHEGYSNYLCARLGFEDIWRTIHGQESWNVNPEVVAITFRVIRANIDSQEAREAA